MNQHYLLSYMKDSENERTMLCTITSILPQHLLAFDTEMKVLQLINTDSVTSFWPLR